jgi:hypothetical protein
MGWLRAAGLLGIAFGALTLKEGGAVLFGDGTARAAAGDFVPFVLWFNFLAGFCYVASGVGLLLRRRWGVRLALAIVVATALVFAGLGVHIQLGGAFETRTVVAMTLRTSVWAAIFFLASRQLPRAAGSGPGPDPTR